MSLPLQFRYLLLRAAITVGFVSSFWFSLPTPMKAAEPMSSGAGGGYFATPYMLRGQFLFIHRVSRRTLRLTMKATKPELPEVFVREYL